jgi:TIR domain
MPEMSTADSTLGRIFLCHSSGDKNQVRNLYQRLRNDGFFPWLDQEDLLPGQDWGQEIPKAVRLSAVVLVCLSEKAVTKAGYVQKEIKYALDVADEQPEGGIFLIPVRLENCDVPERLRRWQWVDLFEERGYDKLVRALRTRLPVEAGLKKN